MKKFFKIVWKSLLVVAAVAVVFVSALLAYAWFDEYCSFCIDRTLSENVTVRYYYKQEDYRVYNEKLDKIVAQGDFSVDKTSHQPKIVVQRNMKKARSLTP